MNQGEPGAIARRRPYAGAAALLAIGLLLAGCGGSPPSEPVNPTPTTAEPSPTDDAEPTDEPTRQPTDDPTPDPVETVEPPEWDPAMDEPTLEGAFAFGEYFMHLYSYVIATGDTVEWRELSHPDCGFCADTAATAEATGFATDSHEVELTPIGGEEIEPGHYYSLDYSITEWADGSAQPTELLALVGVLREDDRWLMGAVEIHEGDQT